MRGLELIDTCWDVNEIVEKKVITDGKELIDTCWDVNQDSEINWWYSVYGINRYMLGCKYLYKTIFQSRKDRINRYMLGCKFCKITYNLDEVGWELIDTCWDVNIYRVKIQSELTRELIDTCWDVNQQNRLHQYLRDRINRYMLGCKWISFTFPLINSGLN